MKRGKHYHCSHPFSKYLIKHSQFKVNLRNENNFTELIPTTSYDKAPVTSDTMKEGLNKSGKVGKYL